MVVFLLSCPCLSVFRVHAPHAKYWLDNNLFYKNVNMFKLLRILFLGALTLKVTNCSKVSLEINDFDLRAQKKIISEYFQIFATLYKVDNYINIVWHVKYELWIHEGLKMREKILSRSKFQLKTWVFLNIRHILRLKGMVPAIILTS
jgi:hypothetical protein